MTAAVDTTAAASGLDSRVVADAVQPSVSTTLPPAEPAATVSTLTRVGIASGIASTVVNALSPFANDAPTTPVEPPTLWTLLAFARREFEQTVNQSPTVNPLAGQITNGLVTDTPTLDGQSIDPGITGNIGAPTRACRA